MVNYNSLILKRIKALVIDYSFCIIIIAFVFSFCINENILKISKISFDELPFFFFQFNLAAFLFVPKMIFLLCTDFNNAKNNTLQIILLIIIPIVEIIYFTITMMLFKKSIGQIICGITIETTSMKKLYFYRCIIRGILKAISKYLFFIPNITIFFTKYNQTIYDLICGTAVIKKDSY